MSFEREILFTIPIYGLSKEKLKSKVEDMVEDIKQTTRDLDDYTRGMLIDHCTFPYRCWQYNHIVGYIEVSAGLNDVYFNLYLPYKKKKYYWNTTRKTLLHNVGPDCLHFRIFEDDSSELIIEKIRERMKETEEMIPKQYYIDYELFELYSKYMDIRSLLRDFREKENQ